MENQTKINTTLVIAVLALIAGFTTIAYNLPGEYKPPTHYCKSTRSNMYCERITSQYCYPDASTRNGSKRCTEGWKEIPFIQEVQLEEIKAAAGNRQSIRNWSCIPGNCTPLT